MNNHSNFLVCILVLSVLSCSKNPPINQPKIWECHHESTWDALSTKNALLGEWEWKYIDCFAEVELSNKKEFEGLSIQFFSNNTLVVIENGHITQTSEWEVEIEDLYLYGLTMSPPVFQLYGRLLFCDDQVKFNDHYRDGCDNFFERK